MVESIHILIKNLQIRKHNIRFREIEKKLMYFGFIERYSRRGTSHRVFSHPKLIWNITLVTHGKSDLLPFYQVHDIIRALQELEELLP